MNYNIQQDSHEYSQGKYMTVQRWSTYAKVISETMKLNPKNILEIGPGNNIVTDVLKKMNYEVKTLDLDNSVHPDYNFSLTDEKINSLKIFDLVIASQVLEHIRYDDFPLALKRLSGMAKNAILTLPHTTSNSILFSFSLKLPFLKKIKLTRKIFFKKIKHNFNGLHYWEIGKDDYPIEKIREDIARSDWKIFDEFLNPENPFHYFFILKKHD
ncbi:MAG TPA: methyltransferase type 11 [Candidatus Moranbacteria bacterium]|nr:methyltransferase type 11 [Candidatus Moranbacteria bacterium]